MNYLTDSRLTVAVPITEHDRATAEQFAKQHANAEKSIQVYRNTLAVLTTHRYLEWLSIQSTYEQSQSWNCFEQTFSNVADLFVLSSKGAIECRPVEPGSDRAFVPEEVQQNRIGYVMVQLDTAYQEAILLGFVAQVSVTQLPLTYLQPLDDLIDHLLETKPTVDLGNWLKGMFDPNWLVGGNQAYTLAFRMRNLALIDKQTANEATQNARAEELQSEIEQLYQKAQLDFDPALLHNPHAALALLIRTVQNDEIRWQAAELLSDLDPSHPLSPIISTKDLGVYLAGHAIALQVGVLTKSDQRRLILLRLYPLKQAFLPTGLRLTGFDTANHLLFQVEARPKDTCIQFKLTADEGDRFRVQAELGDGRVSEIFLV